MSSASNRFVTAANQRVSVTRTGNDSPDGLASAHAAEVPQFPVGRTDSTHGTRTGSPVTTNNSPPEEPCPSPMTWLEVRDAFFSQSVAWELKRGGARITGRTCGTGRPLYFLNGFGGTHELYIAVGWLLRESFRCVLFDYPGRADRMKPRVPRSISDLVDDLFTVADRHGDRELSLFGSSFGGLVAWQALLANPRRVIDAAVVCGFAHRELSFSERMLIRVGRHLGGRFRNLPGRESLQVHNHRRWFPPFDAGRWQFFLKNTGDVPIKDLADRTSIMQHADLRTQLHEIQQPVLVIRTEGEGSILARCQKSLEAGLPNARSERLHSCGHLPFLTHPHQLAKVLRGVF